MTTWEEWFKSVNEKLATIELKLEWGCIRLYPHSSHNGRQKQRLPYLAITNTDKDLLEYTQSLFTKLGIKSRIYTIHVKPIHWKTRYELRVTGFKSFGILGSILKRGLISEHRKKQFQIVLEKINERNAKLAIREERFQAVLVKIREGQNARQIARQLNFHPRYIYELLRRRGLTFSKVRSFVI